MTQEGEVFATYIIYKWNVSYKSIKEEKYPSGKRDKSCNQTLYKKKYKWPVGI